jgi:hypothetical protein
MGQTLCTESAFEQRLSNGHVKASHERLDCVPKRQMSLDCVPKRQMRQINGCFVYLYMLPLDM